MTSDDLTAEPGATGTPWWQRYLDGEEGAGPDLPAGQPSFATFMGVLPAGWERSGVVHLRWRPPPVTRTPGGWVQGGFQAVVLDMAQTFSVFTRLGEGQVPMTLELKTSYIEAAFAEAYRVTARALRVGRTAAHTEASLRDEEGRLIATSSATHVIRRIAR